MKIRTFFAQKVVFGKVTYGPWNVFILIFTSVQLSKLERQGPQLRGKNITKLACLVQILENFMSKTHFLVEIIAHC
jgi:hypothetical protein